MRKATNQYINLTCAHCGNEFKRLTKQYKYAAKVGGENYKTFCSDACSKQFISTKQKITCDNCGIEIIRTKKEINEKYNFCSHSCFATFNNAKRTQEGYTSKGKTKKSKCTECGTDIEINVNSGSYLCEPCREKQVKIVKERNAVEKICPLCNNTFTDQQYKKYCNNCQHEAFRRAGCASAAKRADTRRSKNEMYLAELCQKEFPNVTCNQPIFEGWDCDIQLNDYKIAIHWNGQFHYVECGGYHSLKQVQARDKVKQAIINKLGWTNYIIKDMGKYKKEFVEEEFEKLKEFIRRLK